MTATAPEATGTTGTTDKELTGDELGIIPLGGRYFTQRAQTTDRQDRYIAARLAEAEFEKLRGELSDEGDMSDLAIRIIKVASDKDLVYEIMGAILTETNAAGEPLPLFDKQRRPQRWTREKAEEVANFLANLEDEKDKENLSELQNLILILFFTTGVQSSLTSQSSSEAAGVRLESMDTPTSSATPEPAGSSRPAPEKAPPSDLMAVLDPSITASGIRSSAK